MEENEYGDTFDFESFCADDFADEQPIHPKVWAGINWEAGIPDDLRLLPDEMSEWDCVFGKENRGSTSTDPPAKKRKGVVRKPLESRFGNQVTTQGEFEKAGKGFVPENTEASTRWALRNFQAWTSWRAESGPDKRVPEDLLEKCEPQELDKWLSLYVMETRHEDGKPFPLKSIDGLLAGLKRYMKTQNKYTPNIFSEEDPRFSNLRGTRDTVARKLREEGVGAFTKEAEIISIEDEQVIWQKNVMGTHSPKALLYAVFFANGKNLCLRGGQEHHTLKISQLVFGKEDKTYVLHTYLE